LSAGKKQNSISRSSRYADKDADCDRSRQERAREKGCHGSLDSWLIQKRPRINDTTDDNVSFTETELKVVEDPSKSTVEGEPEVTELRNASHSLGDTFVGDRVFAISTGTVDVRYNRHLLKTRTACQTP
jgi:hypothetical protein